jgi:hypothetical protein
MDECQCVHESAVCAKGLLAGAFELILLDEMPVVCGGAAFEEISKCGAGIAFGVMAEVVKRFQRVVVMLDGLVRGFERKQAHGFTATL